MPPPSRASASPAAATLATAAAAASFTSTASVVSPLAPASASEVSLLVLLLVLHDVDDLVGHPQVFDVVSLHVNLREANELVGFGAGLDDLLQGQVHPGVALYQVAIECLSVLQLDQHGVALRRVQEAEGQHLVAPV